MCPSLVRGGHSLSISKVFVKRQGSFEQATGQLIRIFRHGKVALQTQDIGHARFVSAFTEQELALVQELLRTHIIILHQRQKARSLQSLASYRWSHTLALALDT